MKREKYAWKEVIRNFYPDLDEAVQKAEKELESVKIEDEVTDVVCEECGRNMVIKYGPHGKFLACPGIPGMQKYEAVSGKNRSTMSDMRKRCRDPQDEKGKKILRL